MSDILRGVLGMSITRRQAIMSALRRSRYLDESERRRTCKRDWRRIRGSKGTTVRTVSRVPELILYEWYGCCRVRGVDVGVEVVYVSGEGSDSKTCSYMSMSVKGLSFNKVPDRSDIREGKYTARPTIKL
jgi:hypothetical protein